MWSTYFIQYVVGMIDSASHFNVSRASRAVEKCAYVLVQVQSLEIFVATRGLWGR